MSADYRGRDVVVLGLGMTGLALARFLARRGANLRVADTRDAPPNAARLAAELPGVPLARGPLTSATFAGAELVAISPGVPHDHPALAEAVARGADLAGDVELFARELPPAQKVVAITGTNGKTTTTALAGELARAAGLRTTVAGNIGVAVLDALSAIEDGADWPDLFVLELSSYQLETVASLKPAAATVLNVSPNHLDRYAGIADYAAAKARIFDGARVAVLNRDDPIVRLMRRPGQTVQTFGASVPQSEEEWGLVARGGGAWLARGGELLLPAAALALAGRHNALNALAALALVSAVARIRPAVLDAAKAFRGLPHRMERVAESGGVAWINDSKATTVAATEAALGGFAAPVVLIAGGDAKGQGFGALGPAVDAHCRAVLLIGRDAARVARGLAGARVPVEDVGTLDAAVARARSRGRATPCCSRRPARASTSSRTTRRAARASPSSPAPPRRPAVRNRVRETATLRLPGVLGNAFAAPARTMATWDAALGWSALVLLALGLVMVYSSSIAMAEASAHTGHRAWYFLARHAVFVAAGLAAGLLVFQVPVATWQKLAPWLFLAGIALLALVLVPGIGRSVNGSRRWLSLGLVNVQPSEFMKLAVVLYAASYAVRKAAFLHARQPLRQTLVRGFAPLFATMVLIGGLLLLEPDFGAFVVILAIGFAILFVGGLDWRLFAGLAALLPFALGAILVAAPYRLQRLTAFLDPWSDPLGKGYQLTHSLIAFGRGEIVGVGLGASVEKLLYLPEAHTDFLLAVIAEELGLAGVLVVLALFVLILVRAWAIGRQAARLSRPFAALVAQGIGAWIGVQAFINIGVNMGVLPTKGLTLPLLSFGGSALVATCAAVAILLRIDYENRRLLRGYPV